MTRFTVYLNGDLLLETDSIGSYLSYKDGVIATLGKLGMDWSIRTDRSYCGFRETLNVHTRRHNP